MRVSGVLVLAVLIPFAAHGEEATSTKSGVAASFEAFGYHETKQIDAGHCSVTGELNQKKFLESFPVLQKLGILNEELPKSSVNTKPFTLSSAFLLVVIPLETKSIYDENEKADHCSFNQALTIVDDYGNDTRVPALSYKFNRALFKKINWDQFDSTKVPKVFPSFTISPALLSKMGEERASSSD